MKTLLYIGHDYHNKTKSTQFLQELLCAEYQVEHFNYDPYSDSDEIFKVLEGKSYDIVVLFQIMPSLKVIDKYIKYKFLTFFPMYDTAPWIYSTKWKEYAACTIINFSSTLHKELLSHGFASHYIQYFPKPSPIENWGDENSFFFWQRTSDIAIDTIEQLVDIDQIKHLHFHQAIDPSYEIIMPAKEWENKISYSTWYETREEMQKDIANAALYIAPRKYEGIGLSFLEAMAMGRCVIAPNESTMNEYIEHGKTGLLYDLAKPCKLDLHDILSIQKRSYEYMQSGYEKWEKEKFNLLKIIESPASIDRAIFKKYKTTALIKRFLKFCFHTTKDKRYTRVKVFNMRILKLKA